MIIPFFKFSQKIKIKPKNVRDLTTKVCDIFEMNEYKLYKKNFYNFKKYMQNFFRKYNLIDMI